MITLIKAQPIIDHETTALQSEVYRLQQSGQSVPKLVIISVGDDTASKIYINNKLKWANRLGVTAEHISFSSVASAKDVQDKINIFNTDPSVTGIILQRPLPSQFNIIECSRWVVPKKDVDGLHPDNVGALWSDDDNALAPCTALGVLHLLKYYNIALSGQKVAIFGRGAIIGKPVAALLLKENASPLWIHQKTKNPIELSSQCEIIIAATGKGGFLKKEYIKKGATVIDVGISRTANGLISGDLSKEAQEHCGAYSPVPGGVGPMTLLYLFKNLLRCYNLQRKH